MRRSYSFLSAAMALSLVYAPASSASPSSSSSAASAPSTTAATGSAASATSPLAQYKPTKPTARAHFEEGNRLYKSGLDTARPFPARVRDLRAAMSEYEAGARDEDAPAFDYNLGHTARVLVDNRVAVAHLQRFLDRARPDGQLRTAIEAEISEIDPTGELRVGLKRSDHQQAPAPVAVAPAAPTPAVGASPSSRPAPTTPPVDVAEPGHGWSWLGWSLTAAGLVGGGVSAGLAFSAAGLDNDAKDPTRGTSDRVDLQNRADSRRRSALIVGVGGGAVLVLGIVTLAIPARRASRNAAAWNLGITGRGIAVFGRF